MKRTTYTTLSASVVFMAAMLLVVAPVWTQEPSAPPAAAAQTFSQQDLDSLLAPIALYPDALLAQMFMASTYPLEIVQAARWVKENPSLKGKALEDALQNQTWDPAVKSLTTVPQALQQMNDNLEWTQKLGDAFLAQQKQVMETVQALRAKAKAAGNLESTQQQVVKTENKDGQTIYIIESPKPEVIYVPTYNPTVVYGTWWYSYPPYYMYPPYYAYPPGVGFGVGIIVGAAIWGNCNWHGNNVNVHVSHYNSFNRTNISNKDWNHDVDHRKGVAYRDQQVAQKYNRGASAQTDASRDQYRGRADSGVSTSDRNAGSRDRTSAGTSPVHTTATSRDAGSSSSSRGNHGGFSGASSGASTRAASTRGGASMGGGRGGGGRR